MRARLRHTPEINVGTLMKKGENSFSCTFEGSR